MEYLPAVEEVAWLDPAELVREGFRRSRIVMMNEAHNGWRRCVRTRLVGRQVLPAAWKSGAHFLAMEALGPPGQEPATPPPGTYLSQPEMEAMTAEARRLGFSLHGYEADPQAAPEELRANVMGLPYTNWREERQAANLTALLGRLPPEGRLLVWCGHGHLRKSPRSTVWADGDWTPMGWWFHRLSGLEPFCIDQTVTVKFAALSGTNPYVERYRAVIEAHGGTVGAVVPPELARQVGADAAVLSFDNELE